jgi:hypothetical protein
MPPSYIYLLPLYANKANLRSNRGQTEDEYKITFSQGGTIIELSETNSLVEDKYSLNLRSARYVVEGSETGENQAIMPRTVQREAMIHHHPEGHPWRHLQFKLVSGHEVIRIKLENLDQDDYESCIKGFLAISYRIIEHERVACHISANLKGYFFNAQIDALETDRIFLLNQVKIARNSNAILDNSNNPVTNDKLNELKSEIHLLPFFDWEE